MLSALLCAAAALAAAGGRSPPMPRHPGHGSRRMQNSATDVRVQPQVADAPVAWSGSGSWAWGWELGEHNEGPHAIFTPFTVALVAITCVVGIIPLAAHYAAKVKPQHPPKFWKPPEMRRDASDGVWRTFAEFRTRYGGQLEWELAELQPGKTALADRATLATGSCGTCQGLVQLPATGSTLQGEWICPHCDTRFVARIVPREDQPAARARRAQDGDCAI
eukprot:TRINITY_DN28954_c0_g1_i2.p1 TRINITY_DN28954_c0_g1~~TRINITY_DN28954_c0_g1_i2.p1  ORF type:complete len:242 (+),score=64.34 TRINITY_DN28954_c0_g1_i2:67-726(+)